MGVILSGLIGLGHSGLSRYLGANFHAQSWRRSTRGSGLVRLYLCCHAGRPCASREARPGALARPGRPGSWGSATSWKNRAIWLPRTPGVAKNGPGFSSSGSPMRWSQSHSSSHHPPVRSGVWTSFCPVEARMDRGWVRLQQASCRFEDEMRVGSAVDPGSGEGGSFRRDREEQGAPWPFAISCNAQSSELQEDGISR